MKSFLATFKDIWRFFFWSHWTLRKREEKIVSRDFLIVLQFSFLSGFLAEIVINKLRVVKSYLTPYYLHPLPFRGIGTAQILFSISTFRIVVVFVFAQIKLHVPKSAKNNVPHFQGNFSRLRPIIIIIMIIITISVTRKKLPMSKKVAKKIFH